MASGVRLECGRRESLQKKPKSKSVDDGKRKTQEKTGAGLRSGQVISSRLSVSGAWRRTGQVGLRFALRL